MSAFVRALSIATALAMFAPEVALAGMPMVTLTDVARMRVQTISFFLAGLLASAWFVKLLWNFLRKDFSSLPRLSYGKALGVVVLWGSLFILVLTMISGARELMTPGAWEKQGATYRLSQSNSPLPADSPHLQERRRKLDRLRAALWNFAKAHQGRFPASETVKDEIPSEYWLASESPRFQYLYVTGQVADRDASPLVYEPEIDSDHRLVLLTSGAIKIMALDEILRALPPEKP